MAYDNYGNYTEEGNSSAFDDAAYDAEQRRKQAAGQVQNPGNVGAGTGVAAPVYPDQPQQPAQQNARPAGAKDYGPNASGKWLGWIHDTYGPSQKMAGQRSDSGAFSDLPEGVNLSDVVARFNADTGSNARFVGGPSGDQVDFGEGIRDVKTSGGQLWYDFGPGGVPGGGGGAGGGGNAGGGGGFSAGGGGGNAGIGDARANTLFDLLMKRASASENIDPNDPIIKAQTDAYSAQGQQARRDFLAQQAEKAGPYGNQTSEERRSAEELGKSTGSFQAQAMQNELNARRAQIEHALSGAAGFLTNQQQLALQEELSKLQLAQQESQFGRNLNQGAYQFDVNRQDSIFG